MKNLKLLLPCVAILTICVILGSFFDLDINTALFSKNNWFGLLMASIGELPAYGGISFAGGIMFGYASKNFKGYKKSLGYLFGIIFALAGACLMGMTFKSVNAWGAITDKLDKLYIYGPIGLALISPCFLVGGILGYKTTCKHAIWIAIIILAVIGGVALLTTILKVIIHRPRFRYLYNSGNMDLYHDWWKAFTEYENYETLEFTSEEFKSFPSGHTSSSGVLMFILAMLPLFIPALEDKQTELFICGFLWMVLVAFTRMMIGAHFLSDVSMGGLISLLGFVVGDFIIKRFIYKNEELYPQLIAVDE